MYCKYALRVDANVYTYRIYNEPTMKLNRSPHPSFETRRYISIRSRQSKTSSLFIYLEPFFFSGNLNILIYFETRNCCSVITWKRVCVKTIFPRSVASVRRVINDPIIEMNRSIKAYLEVWFWKRSEISFSKGYVPLDETLSSELYGCNCNNICGSYILIILMKTVLVCYKMNYV